MNTNYDVERLIQFVVAHKIEQERIDDLVYDAMAGFADDGKDDEDDNAYDLRMAEVEDRASEINNQGLADQFEFLLTGNSADGIMALLRS